jgi:ketosteroid isomerase-like protein
MTTQADETRAAVMAYFNAWTSNDPKAARAALADDLEFIGPGAHYTSADAFYPALVGFAALTKRARLDELYVDGDRAAMVYDCELPAPAGEFRIASFFRVAGGKIVRYETLFDPTGFRALQAQLQRG